MNVECIALKKSSAQEAVNFFVIVTAGTFPEMWSYKAVKEYLTVIDVQSYFCKLAANREESKQRIKEAKPREALSASVIEKKKPAVADTKCFR